MSRGRKRILVLSGVHGAGKSTIGKAMATGHRFSYYDEIGRRLRGSVSCRVIESCFLFDREVMTLELDRDPTLQQDECIPVVESWHIGNIAFALARNNAGIAQEYTEALESCLWDFDPWIAVIQIDDETFLWRSSERGITGKAALPFYRVVEQHALNLIESFGLNHVMIDGTQDVNDNVVRLSIWIGEEKI